MKLTLLQASIIFKLKKNLHDLYVYYFQHDENV